ncbi:hypothetical protein [Caballeronia sordidicola]|uniref:hypothetical protein n=1 Tax=Caballeronia sordidicola TaxID=196367 RepID=UPI000B2FDD17|nr:hypothetical protein [Caballeronia sordidicola]
MQRSTRVSRTRASSAAVALTLLIVSPIACRADHAPDRATIVAQIKESAEHTTGKPPEEIRTTAGNCVPGGVPADSPFWNSVLIDYKNLSVQDCSPTIKEPTVEGGHLTGRALLLLPTAAQAAEWIVSACETQGLSGALLQKCATNVWDYVNGQNNLQFVIAGVITEPNSEGYLTATEAPNAACSKLAKAQVLYSFRDGITVKLKGQPRTSFRAGIEGGCRPYQPKDLAALIVTDPATVAIYGRVAGLTRALYSACTHAAPPTDDAWRDLIKSSMIKAWSSNRYSMMDIVAQAIAAPRGACRLVLK